MRIFYRGSRVSKRGTIVERIHDHGDEMFTKDLDRNLPGFDWGYKGDFPRQLSKAILADYTNDYKLAMRLHLHFMDNVISGIKTDNWKLDEDVIRAFIISHEGEPM